MLFFLICLKHLAELKKINLKKVSNSIIQHAGVIVTFKTSQLTVIKLRVEQTLPQ